MGPVCESGPARSASSPPLKTCLGDTCGDGKLHLFVNGKPAADPNLIVLSQHLEIAVAFGQPPRPVPSSYGF
ncbi:MAG: hypothetical protein ACXVRS_11815 [Gaiellaceae bacterium]